MLTIIDLSFYLNKNILDSSIKNVNNSSFDFFYGNRILFNNYETLYYINDNSGCIISFTINGFKISKKNIRENNSLFSPYLINIFDEFRFLYCDAKNKQIIEYNPINFEEIFFIYDLSEIKINDKNIIKALFYNSKSFDL